MFANVRANESGLRRQPQFDDYIKPDAQRSHIDLAVWPVQEKGFEVLGFRGEYVADHVVPHERGSDRGGCLRVMIEVVGIDAEQQANSFFRHHREIGRAHV